MHNGREMPVSGAGGETIWTARDAKAIPAALRALREGYRVLTRPGVEVHRVWLDTADWRLHRAGAALAAVRNGDGPATLEFSPNGSGAVDVVEDADGGPWPRLLDGLPADLRPRLARIVDIRALLTVAEVSGSIVTGALLDDEGKTVVRLVHERPAEIAGTGVKLPARLHLIPVRGYQADSKRAARILRSAGLIAETRSAYDLALVGSGRDPSGPTMPAMGPDQPGSVAVATVLLGFLAEMEATLEGTIADIDTEFLHDFRVAVRRSRSAVKLLGDALPAALAAWAAPQLKWLGDLTTPVRDLDVHLLGLPDAGARLHGGRPEDLQPLANYLEQIREAERRSLVRGLRSARFTRFRTRWRGELEKIAAGGTAEGGLPALLVAEQTAAELARERLARAHRRVLKPGSRITPASPAEDLHNLRKRGKELRYLLEIFAGLLDTGHARGLVKDLKGLQDVLGAFQDSEVQREAVVALAESMLAAGGAPAATFLAMGEIAARLHDDQLAAREEFEKRFQRFADATPGGGIASLVVADPPG